MISEALCRGMTDQGPVAAGMPSASSTAALSAAPAQPPPPINIDAVLARILSLLDREEAVSTPASSAKCPPAAPVSCPTVSASDTMLVVTDKDGNMCSATTSNVGFKVIDVCGQPLAIIENPILLYEKILDVSTVSKKTATIVRRILAIQQESQDAMGKIDEHIANIESFKTTYIQKLASNATEEEPAGNIITMIEGFFSTIIDGLNKYKKMYEEIKLVTTEKNLEKIGKEAVGIIKTDKEKARSMLISIYAGVFKLSTEIHTLFTNAVADPFNMYIVYDRPGGIETQLQEKRSRQEPALIGLNKAPMPEFYNIKDSIEQFITNLPYYIQGFKDILFYTNTTTALDIINNYNSTHPFIARLEKIYEDVETFNLIADPSLADIDAIKQKIMQANIDTIKATLDKDKSFFEKIVEYFKKQTLVQLGSLDQQREISVVNAMSSVKVEIKAANEVLKKKINDARTLINEAVKPYDKVFNEIKKYNEKLEKVTIGAIETGVQRKQQMKKADIAYEKKQVEGQINLAIDTAERAKHQVTIDIAAMQPVTANPEIVAIIASAEATKRLFDTAYTDMSGAKAQFKEAVTIADVKSSVETIKSKSAICIAKALDIKGFRAKYTLEKTAYDTNQITILNAALARAQASAAAGTATATQLAQLQVDIARLQDEIAQHQADLATLRATAAANAPTLNKAANEAYLKKFISQIITDIATKTGVAVTDADKTVTIEEIITNINNGITIDGVVISISNPITNDTLVHIFKHLQPPAPAPFFTDIEITEKVKAYIEGAPANPGNPAATPPVLATAEIPAHPLPAMRGGGRHRVTRRRLTGSKRRKTYVRRGKNSRHQ